MIQDSINVRGNNRKYYLDYLKLFLVFLVIIHHSLEAYSINSQWRYKDSVTVGWLERIHTVNMTFFMGLFFFISGYFIVNSYKSRGTREFVLNKAKRLLLPVIFILSVIVPTYFYFIEYFANGLNKSYFDYYLNVYLGTGIISYEHGWFLVSLFMYSMLFLLFTKIISEKTIKKVGQLNYKKLLIIIAIMSILTAIVSSIYEYDQWIRLFGIIGLEPIHLPQYLIMFIVGIIAFKNKWLDQITTKLGWTSVTIGLIMSSIIYLNRYLPDEFINTIYSLFFIYEPIMCVSICIALLFIFKKYFNKENKIFVTLSQCSFGVYICHNLFIVSMQLFLGEYEMLATLKFIIVTICSAIMSFLAVYLVRRIRNMF